MTRTEAKKKRLHVRLQNGCLLMAAALWSCGGPWTAGSGAETERSIGGTRGYILISLDALSAYHVGAYGYERDTTPFFDSLAQQGALFENAVVQYPSTLLSHMSMFTGLYPRQHAVFPPTGVLSPQIPTLAERFRDLGYRTAGHTEAVYMSEKYGIARGFEDYSEHFYNEERGVNETFARGVRFLENLTADEPFFVMLHTYAVHDPYMPPEPYHSMFLEEGQEIPDFPLRGEFFREANEGKRDISAAEVSYMKSLYDAQVRYVDDALELLMAELDRLGLRDETTIIVTSDHGEEFRQHGKLVHVQVYPEVLFVPLLILHPELEGGTRISAPVEVTDIAPTLWELAGMEYYEPSSAISLVPYLVDSETRLRDEAYGETLFGDQAQKTLVRAVDGELYQLVAHHTLPDEGGVWFANFGEIDIELDASQSTIDFRAVAFDRPRSVEVVVHGDGAKETHQIDLTTDWNEFILPAPGACAPCKLTLRTDGCVSPLERGLSEDSRCLGFKIAGPEVHWSELFNLSRDPGATSDTALEQREIWASLLRGLSRYRFAPVAPPGDQPLDENSRRVLESLGYL